MVCVCVCVCIMKVYRVQLCILETKINITHSTDGFVTVHKRYKAIGVSTDPFEPGYTITIAHNYM